MLTDDRREPVDAFAAPAAAVAAALDIQRARAVPGLHPGPRIGLHTGEAQLRDDRSYTGPAVQRGTRLRDLAHPGQTLLSSTTASLVADDLPPGAWLADLGTHRLRDLSRPERVFELRHADLPLEHPPLRSLDELVNNLPVQLTSFVGRAEELADVAALLDKERLVTLTGAGGSGKTRLALQAAAERADSWRDGVWWVDLAPVTDPALVAELLASTLGVLVEPVGGPLRALTLQLRDRHLLLCLDNSEHLLDASAEVAESLLRSCPEVSVLVTSREPLGVTGETVWRVPSLAEDEAVTLFAERASRVRPWFTVDATTGAAVRTVCRRLDGIPLAIELAAAWLRTLTPAQIAAGLDDRFRLLVRGPRGVLPRQRTLLGSIDWSHDLLDETDRTVFRRLAAFPGGFALDAARAVCAGGPVAGPDVLGALGRLVDKSLVAVDEPVDDDDGEARYRLLETMRQYAGERLEAAGETASTLDRHLDHFLALAEDAGPELEGPGQDAWLARLEAEHDNLRAALDWALSLPDAERGRRLASPVFWLWFRHGHAQEGLDFLRRAIERTPEDRSGLQATLLIDAAALGQASGQFGLIVEYAERALDIATANADDRTRGMCLHLLGVVQFYLDPDAAAELWAEAGRCAEATGDAFTADSVVVLQGSVLCTRDRHEAARPLLQEGRERCLRRNDRTFAALALNYQDDTALLTGDVAAAVQLARQALRVAEPLGDYYAVGLATLHLAFATAVAGDIAAAQRLMEPVVRSVEGAEDAYVPRLGAVMGKLCLWNGDTPEAVEWFERDVRDVGPMADSLITARALPGLAAALRRLGRRDEARARVERALTLARKLDVPHLVAEALEQAAFLALAEAPSRTGEAEDLHHEALAVRVDRGLRTFMVDSLDALAGLAARAESFVEAARLLAASGAARRAMGYPRRPCDRAEHAALVASLRGALGDNGFADASQRGAALPLDEAVAYARRARGTRGRPSAGWASLTPTELDVVRLVADGLTNPEIGARLFMSRATVKTHLSHVFAKLRIANRVELAALASAQAPTGDPSGGSPSP